MLTLETAFALADHPGVVLFRDDEDPGLVHLVPTALAVESTGSRYGAQLTLMGRGPKDSDSSVIAAFWTLSLESTLTEAGRQAIATALAPEGGLPPRLVLADLDLALDLKLTETPPLGARASVRGWRGGTVALSGDASGKDAAALAKAWEAGLPHSRLDATLAVRGMGGARTMNEIDATLEVRRMAPSAARLAVSTHSLRSREAQADTAAIRIEEPLGFDREALRRGTIMAGFSD